MIINPKKLKFFPILFTLFYIISNIIPENIPAQYDILTLKPSRIHYPGIHDYEFTGGVYYYPSKKKFQYIQSEYDPNGKRILEKIYDIAGNIKQIIRYYYNDEGLITREEFFNDYQEIVKQVHYKGKKNRDFENENYEVNVTGNGKKSKKKYHVEYNYNYNDKNQLVNKLEYIYDISSDDFQALNYIKVKSSVITYLNNKKIIEYYSKTADREDFVFEGAEVFQYIYPNKVYRLIDIDRHKTIKKVIQYYYDEKYRARKVSIYTAKRIIPWSGILRDTFNGDFELNYFIIYSYNKGMFTHLVQDGISNHSNVGTDIPKYQRMEHTEGPSATKKFLSNGNNFIAELSQKHNQEAKNEKVEEKSKEKEEVSTTEPTEEGNQKEEDIEKNK